MKTIPPDPVPMIKLVWDRVKIRVFGQALVKRGVKDSDLGNACSENSRTCSNSFDVCRVMQRCELDTVFDAAHHIFRDDRRTGEPFTTVDHAVTDRVNVFQAGNDRRGREPLNDSLDSGLNVLDRRSRTFRWLLV